MMRTIRPPSVIELTGLQERDTGGSLGWWLFLFSWPLPFQHMRPSNSPAPCPFLSTSNAPNNLIQFFSNTRTLPTLPSNTSARILWAFKQGTIHWS